MRPRDPTPLTPEELSATELADQHARELPDREAMSLISGDQSAAAWLGSVGSDDFGLADATTDDTGTTDAATSTTGQATSATDDLTSLAGVDADAAGSDDETVNMTADDRSEQISQSDTASAGPA